MSTLQEPNDWADTITQIDTTDPVMGGPDGIDNLPHRQLAARTRYLRKTLEALAAAVASLAADYQPRAATAVAAAKWATARKLTLKGAVSGAVSLDGSADVEIPTTAAAATAAAAGVVALASSAEALAGTDTAKAVTPKALDDRLGQDLRPSASPTFNNVITAGAVFVGTTTGVTNGNGGIVVDVKAGSALNAQRYLPDPYGSDVYHLKTRGGAWNVQGAVLLGDQLHSDVVMASDGTAFRYAAVAAAIVDGPVSAGVVPACWQWSTAGADGVLREGARLDSRQVWSLLKRPKVAGVDVVLASDFTSNLKPNGYRVEPDGMIVQWGNAAFPGVMSGFVTFPIAFPHECLVAIVCDKKAAPTDSLVLGLGTTLTATQMGVVANAGSSGAVEIGIFSWIAYGY